MAVPNLKITSKYITLAQGRKSDGSKDIRLIYNVENNKVGVLTDEDTFYELVNGGGGMDLLTEDENTVYSSGDFKLTNVQGPVNGIYLQEGDTVIGALVKGGLYWSGEFGFYGINFSDSVINLTGPLSSAYDATLTGVTTLDTGTAKVVVGGDGAIFNGTVIFDVQTSPGPSYGEVHIYGDQLRVTNTVKAYTHGVESVTFDGDTDIVTIPHGLGVLPGSVQVTIQDVTHQQVRSHIVNFDEDNITVSFALAPPAGSNAICWMALK